jgi:formyltetrahydrofolate-dependent phosphoribosylglycinamide formyltransferase
MRRLVVLVSGSGTNLQAVLDACALGAIPAEVIAVVSNRPGVAALGRASRARVAAHVLERQTDEHRHAYDRRLADLVASFEPDLVVLAGWMRILTMEFLRRFPERVVNLHPALPGEYPGVDAIRRAHDDALAGRRDHTGVMVHLVPDEGVDDGPVLATATVPIHPTDSLDDLAARVHAVEHRLLVETLATLCIPSTQGAPA